MNFALILPDFDNYFFGWVWVEVAADFDFFDVPGFEADFDEGIDQIRDCYNCNCYIGWDFLKREDNWDNYWNYYFDYYKDYFCDN